MVRGHAKQVAQEKNAKKQEALRKQANRDAGDDKKTKKAITCASRGVLASDGAASGKICRISLIGEKALRDHYASKHDGKELKPADYGL